VRRGPAGWLVLDGGRATAQLDDATVARLAAAPPPDPTGTPEGVIAACAGRLRAAALLVLRPGARPDEATLHATRRDWETVLRAAARAEPPARFIAAVGHRRNGALVAGLLGGRIAPQAVTLSRERRRQVVLATTWRWARARFPHFMRTYDRLRRARPWSPPPPRALPLPVRWPPELAVVPTPPVLPPAGTYTMRVAPWPPLTAGPYVPWQVVLASLTRPL
jgi:hypothetical protein